MEGSPFLPLPTGMLIDQVQITETGLYIAVIELDPHEVGHESANWTTELLAEYLGQQTGIAVTHETTVRIYLHAHGYVCKRPTWTEPRKAEVKVDYVEKRLGLDVLW